jgi:murein DD-endopeptidase MepM/ murein hydrolase activator NlpD
MPHLVLGVLLALARSLNVPVLPALAVGPADLPPMVVAAEASANGDGWRAPLDGRLHVVHRFQPPPGSAPWTAADRGVDLAAAVGAVVMAAGAGVVTFAGPLAGLGVIVVRHGLLRTTYEPVSPVVRAGARVAVGALLGRLSGGWPRCLPGVCLHWGLIGPSGYVDPLLLLGPVRLLPMRHGAAFPAVATAGTQVPPRDAPNPAGRGRDGTPAVHAIGAVGLSAGGAILGGVGVLRARRRRSPAGGFGPAG